MFQRHESTAPSWGNVWPGPGSSPTPLRTVSWLVLAPLGLPFLLSCSGLPSPKAPSLLHAHVPWLSPRPGLAVSCTSRFSRRSLGERRPSDSGKNALSAGREGSGRCTCSGSSSVAHLLLIPDHMGPAGRVGFFFPRRRRRRVWTRITDSMSSRPGPQHRGGQGLAPELTAA